MYLDERIFLRLVRRMAYLDKMTSVDHLDSILRKHPRFINYKLPENYCVDCDEYQSGMKCRELGCKSAKGYCIPKENTLGLFVSDRFSL